MPWTLDHVFSAFGYTLSLPERVARSLAAAIGGTSKLLTDTLIPEPLRKTTAFTAMIGNTQRFLIEKVADVQGAYPQGPSSGLPEDFVKRAVVGNVINAAGLFAMHLSPLWVFAFVSDIARGSKTYLNRLVEELKTNGVLAADSDIKELDELLSAMGKAGKDTAQVFDLPPVDVASLTALRADLTRGYAGVFKEATDLLPRMDALWEKMQSLAQRDGVAMESIVGLMTLDVGRAAGKAMDAAFTVGSVTTEVLSETVLDSYVQSLERVRERGALACLDEAARPFAEAIAGHFAAGKKSWTEWALDRVRSAFGRPAEPATRNPGQSPSGSDEPPLD